MLVREVMSSPPVVLAPDDEVRWAAEVLLGRHLSAAPVVDEEGRLVGVLSDADLLRHRVGPDPRSSLRRGPLADEEPPARTVADLMTTEVVAVRAGSDVARAAELLVDLGHRTLPVLSGSRVVGVVGRRDLLLAATRPDDDVARDVRTVLADYGAPASWAVEVVDGVVRLRGRERTEASHRLAATLARTVPGVLRVVVDDPAPQDAVVR
ncbi:CBS domain-containing protein [Pseudokineococcus sp. 5B2Z-1]|uniref:CBS domain-containing protein n=1 Tax=Pseudokineococcus sp. 5B2Z-1 TaxID=3132744 RepID=UPI00309F5A59